MPPKASTSPDPVASSHAAGLRYVSDSHPGFRRSRSGKGFRYLDSRGKVVSDVATLERIKSLVIPPAWTDVWICPTADGHLQATGRDARNRKQYRYHALYRGVRDDAKYSRMAAFAQALPKIRKRVRRDLAKHGIPREKVLATVVRLLELTLIRVGNEEYAKENGSFGLTTMRDKHVDIKGSTVKFRFRGKSGQDHDIELSDARIARIVKRCQDLPGEELFQYLDETGAVRDVGSGDVNGYLREITGQDFTAKDFRTWNGTVLAAVALGDCEACASQTQVKKNIVATVKQVAERLGNRPATCRKYYVHPAVLDSYAAGELLEQLKSAKPLRGKDGLSPVEQCVAKLLK